MKGFDLSRIAIDPSGRSVLNDDDLAKLEASFISLAGAGASTKSANGGCINQSCDSSHNQMCQNQRTCDNTLNMRCMIAPSPEMPHL
ncbi:hypothetical protein [Luteimonas fraxinea]|uniref:hypothetical protein n=1 Tax=Luteimonas fraxinea TaxID=2901869 RepID=UPI001E45A965|nr:hypothetical protein [Luteimonas fraxinea]MCD9126006.1 hypothetical protein [Luteimonas fraxinea]